MNTVRSHYPQILQPRKQNTSRVANDGFIYLRFALLAKCLRLEDIKLKLHCKIFYKAVTYENKEIDMR